MRIMVWATLIWVLGSAYGLNAIENPRLQLGVDIETPVISFGVPVAIRLTLTNVGATTEKIEINYPTLQTETSAVEFVLDGRKLTPRCLPTENCSYFAGDGRVPVYDIPASGKLTVVMLSSRFCKSIAVGHHILKYKISLQFGEGKQTVESSGEQSFQVNPENSDELKDFLNKYNTAIHSANALEERTSYEAIMLTDNSAAIPYQIELVKRESSPEYGFPGLAQFPKDEKVRRFIIASILGDKPDTAAHALRVLAYWKYDLEVKTIENLAKHEHVLVRRAVAEYCDSLNSPKFAAVVKMLADDTDLQVKQLAKHALEKKPAQSKKNLGEENR